MKPSTAGYPHDEALRARIQAFSPDEPGIVFPFSARLARENGWVRAFAERVVEEYRRFLYLAVTAGHPVTPPVAVDQAWHLHLTYTRSYWDELCGRVLGRPLHHDPTKGGAAERDKYADWYTRTLDSYRAAFGEEPPPDIWPAPAERFSPATRSRGASDATRWALRFAMGIAGGTFVVVAASAGFAGAVVLLTIAGLGLLGYAIFSSPEAPRTARLRSRATGDAAHGGNLVWMLGGLFARYEPDAIGGSDGGGDSGCGADGGCGGGE